MNSVQMKKKTGTKRKGKLTEEEKIALRNERQRAYRKKIKEKKEAERKQQEAERKIEDKQASIFERLVSITNTELPPIGDKTALIIDIQGRLKFWAMNKMGLFRPVAILPQDVVSFGIRHEPLLTLEGTFKKWLPVGFIKTQKAEYPLTKAQVMDYLRMLQAAKVRLNKTEVEITGIRPVNRIEVRRINRTYSYDRF
jgi:hypothetical protein